MIDTALLAFAATMVASPPQYPPKSPKKPVVAAAKVQQDARFGDFAKAVLKCYHPTARYQGAAIEKRPWAKQKQQAGAKGSAVVSIDYLGVSNAQYTLRVAVLAKPDGVKTVIESDTAKVKAYENCELGDWNAVK
jgi:hypothetical protein